MVKLFLEGEDNKEFDNIIFSLGFMLPSVVLICGGIYALAFYPIKQYFYVSIILGMIWYFIPLNPIGWDTLNGLRIVYFNKKKTAEDKKVQKRRALNVHLSLALFLVVMTTFLIAAVASPIRQRLTGFDPAVFADINTVIVIADSIFAILIATEIPELKKRVLVTYEVLTMGIFFPLIALLAQSLGFPFPALLMATTISIFCMFFLNSTFIYQTKTLLDNPKPALLTLIDYGPDEI